MENEDKKVKKCKFNKKTIGVFGLVLGFVLFLLSWVLSVFSLSTVIINLTRVMSVVSFAVGLLGGIFFLIDYCDKSKKE